MTDNEQRLADGIAALVRASKADGFTSSITNGYNESYRDDKTDNANTVAVTVRQPRPYGTILPKHPPLSPLQLLALSCLVSPTTANASAILDALRECGVITAEWEEMVRKDEREKCADTAGLCARTWRETAGEELIAHDGEAIDRCVIRADAIDDVIRRIRRGTP